MITGKPYAYLKFITLILLPAAGTLYFTLAGIWGLPAAEQVVGTIVAIDTFLGIVLQISSSKYNASDEKYDGVAKVTDTPDKKTFNLVLNDDPIDFDQKKELLFRVQTDSAINKDSLAE